MADFWHGYFGIENLGLNQAQKVELVQALRGLGPASSPQPALLNHWRTRLDDEAAIYEALWNQDKISIDSIKQFLADIFGIDPSIISDSVSPSQYGPTVIFSRGGDRLRMIQFAGIGSSWNESGDATRKFLKDNQSEWEPPA